MVLVDHKSYPVFIIALPFSRSIMSLSKSDSGPKPSYMVLSHRAGWLDYIYRWKPSHTTLSKCQSSTKCDTFRNWVFSSMKITGFLSTESSQLTPSILQVIYFRLALEEKVIQSLNMESDFETSGREVQFGERTVKRKWAYACPKLNQNNYC